MKGQKFDLHAMLEEIQLEKPPEEKKDQPEMSQSEINRLIHERRQKPKPER